MKISSFSILFILLIFNSVTHFFTLQRSSDSHLQFPVLPVHVNVSIVSSGLTDVVLALSTGASRVGESFLHRQSASTNQITELINQS